MLDQFEELSLGWFWATDASGKVTYLSESAADMIGLEPGQIMGTALSELFIPDAADDPDKAERPLGFLLTTRNSFTELQVRLALTADAPKPDRGQDSKPSSDNDDEEAPQRWWSITGKPSFDREGEFLGYRGSAKDITATRERERDASRLAQYDVLTGLANRHRMEKRLSTTLTAYRAAKRSCALLMMDLDRFKQVNDTLGHPAGDELLKQVAQRIEQIVGEKGEIGRLGGDEFQVILPDMDDRGDLGDLSQRLIQMISQPYSINGDRAIIGTSIGIAIAPYDGVSAGRTGQQRRSRAVCGQGRRARPVPLLHRRAEGWRAAKEAGGRRSARCLPSQGAGNALPAADRREDRHGARVRGADALEPRGTRLDRSGGIHPDCRGNRHYQRPWRLGAETVLSRCGGVAGTICAFRSMSPPCSLRTRIFPRS